MLTNRARVVLGTVAMLAAAAHVLGEEPELPERVDFDVHEQMGRLLREIEEDLVGIDALLWDASDGQARALGEANASSRRAVEKIDELLELIHHPHEGT